MCSSARIASRFSVIDTGRPAARSSWTNPCNTSSMDPLAPGATAASVTGAFRFIAASSLLH
jgi:hypothetical protein